MRRILPFIFFFSFLFLALQVQAASFVYEGQISGKTQDPWTLSPGNLLQNTYAVVVTIESPLVTPLNIKSKYEVDPCYNHFCNGNNNDYSALPPMWVTNETAHLGTLNAQVWQLKPNGKRVLVAEKSTKISVYGFQPGKDVIQFGRVNFYVNSEVDVHLPTVGELQVFGYFGHETTPLMVSGTNVNPVISMSEMPEAMKPTWQIISQSRNQHFYAGTLVLHRVQ